MYNAPAVSYPVGRSHIKRAITGALLLLVLGVLGFWCHQVLRFAWPQGLGLGLLLMGALLAVRDDSHTPHGHLSWNGQDWHWASAGQSWLVEIRPQLDGQRFMLLALRGMQPGLDWLWLERESAPLHWDALRRAVWAQDKTRVGQSPGMAVDQP
jgi:hypothetical protein